MTEQLLNDIKDIIKKYDQKLNAVKRTGRIYEPPEYGLKCYALYSGGDIYLCEYNTLTEKRFRVQGNLFYDCESAERESKRREVVQRYRAMADKAWRDAGKVIDWNDRGLFKYSMYYDYDDNIWEYGVSSECKNIGIYAYFPSQETAMQAIKDLGDDAEYLK